MNRQRLILFVLAITFVVAVLWSYKTMPRYKTISDSPAVSGKQLKPAVVAMVKPDHIADDGSKLKLELLDRQTSQFKGYHRNIFKPVFLDELKFAKQKVAAAKLPAISQQPPKQPPVVIPPPAEQVIIQPEASPLARFTFLGFLKKGAVKTIFLAKDKDILLVKKGDTVAGRYEATDISDQELTLTVADTGDEIVIPLVENRPLAAAK